MSLRTLFAIGVTGTILGTQFFIIVVEPSGSYYWPFTTYPMYSAAHYRTDSVSDVRLRVRGCSPDSTDPVSLGSSDVKVPVFQLRDDLFRVAEATRTVPLDTVQLARRAGYVDALVRHAPGAWCQVEIWERRYPNNGTVRSLDAFPWRLAVRWPLGAGADASGWTSGDRIAPDVPSMSALPPLSAQRGSEVRP